MPNKILIVDDSPSIRQMVEATLVSGGYEVSSAEDGQDALEKCQSNQYDFVLTDQNMPRMDGLSLIRALRKLDTYQRTPIVVLTTEASDEMKMQGRAAGATGWMVKPFDPSKLLAISAKVLG